MRRNILVVAASLAIAAPAAAHFVFIVPDSDGKGAIVILSDSLDPDENVDIGKLAATKLLLRRPGALDAAVAWTKGEHSYTAMIPGDGARMVFGATEYGVMKRGDSKPFLLQYHPKAILGDLATSKPLGDAVPVEIVPVPSKGGMRFRVLARGKPLADAQATVMLPGDDAKKVKTDAEGLTPAFEPAGRYGVWAQSIEPKSGEANGKKYEEIRHYATLVVTTPATVR